MHLAVSSNDAGDDLVVITRNCYETMTNEYINSIQRSDLTKIIRVLCVFNLLLRSLTFVFCIYTYVLSIYIHVCIYFMVSERNVPLLVNKYFFAATNSLRFFSHRICIFSRIRNSCRQARKTNINQSVLSLHFGIFVDS